MSSRSKVSFKPQLVRQQGKRKLISSPTKSKSRSQAAQNASRSRSIRSVSVERFSYSPRSIRRMNTSRGATIHRAVPRSQYANVVYGSIRRKNPSVSVHRGFVEFKSPGRRNVSTIKKSRRRVDSIEYE
jgi:hypothetical protein